ncbi:MAG: AAA family ATPase, partial [Methanoregulaceae archaeon]|nr:AAA family ATPase [Methanoregulaceae archaeon]
MSTVQARLFGHLELLQGDTTCQLPASSKARLLLAYLLLHKERTFPRSVLAGLIAPDLPEAQAHHALSQALWHIRRALPGWLESDANQVKVSTLMDLEVDALEFEALAESHLAGRDQPSAALADLKRAVDLYRGDLLEGYYDDWVLLERERLRELYLQVLEKLVAAYKGALQYQQALRIALRLVSAEPLNESAHREVMRLYHYLGQPAEALRQYETCQEILRREFDLEPETETIQIAQAIAQRLGLAPALFLPEPESIQDGSLLRDQTATAIPLVGRGTERTRLVNWLRQGEAGAGRLILIEGEAGVGKTRLLQEAARDAEWHGTQVLWGKATPLANERPLGPFITALDSGLSPLRVEQFQHLMDPIWLQALEPLMPQLAQNLPGLKPLPKLEGEQSRIRLLEGLVSLLSAWANITPLVIIVEDVHWIDSDTFDTLMNLATRLSQVHLSFVVSYRREELADRPEIQAKLSAIQPETVRGRLALTGLDAKAVHKLVHASLGMGETSPAFEGLLHRKTNGNPLFILEVLRGLYDEGVLHQNPEGNWITPFDMDMEDAELPLPPVVEQVISHRLDQLPTDLRELLEALSVLGGEFDFKLIACLGLAEAPALVNHLQALCKRRLLTESPQAYRFSHDKIRQVVYEGLSEEQRTSWHRRLAASLEKTVPEKAEVLALHYMEGRVWHKALEHQQRAAERAQAAQVYTTALGHWDLALQIADHLPLSPEVRFGLHAAHETVLDVLGRRDAQSSDLEAMMRLAQNAPSRLSEAYRRQGRWLLNSGRFTEAEETARQAVALATTSGDEMVQLLARITLAETTLYHGTHDIDEAVAILRSVGATCQRTGNLQLEAQVHDRLSRFDRLPNPVRKEEAQAALALYQRLGDRAGEATALCALGILCYEAGDAYEAILDYNRRALEIARAIGYRLLEARALANLATGLSLAGQIGQALQSYADAIAIFEQIGDSHRANLSRLYSIRLHCMVIGPSEETKKQAETALAYGQQSGNPWLAGYAQFMLGIHAWHEGRYQAAKKWLTDASQTSPSHPSIEQTRLVMDVCQARMLMEQGQCAAALELQEKALSRARQGHYTPMEVSLLADKGLSLLALGQLEAAHTCTAEAVARLTLAVDQPWRVLFAHSKVLTAMGHSGEALTLLTQAHQMISIILASLTPEQQAQSRTLADHRPLLEAWQAIQPQQVTVRLPRASAPLGRPLHEDEWVEVNWTIAAPEDDDIPGKVERRRSRLVRLLRECHEQGAVTTRENLAQALGVSLRTIAADLAALEA